MLLIRRIAKWIGLVIASLFVLSVMIVGALRVWLEHSPQVTASIVARVEAVTGLWFGFEKLDATIGWYGPELVFTKARILAGPNGATLITAQAGRVAFDVWRALRSARLASARVILDGPVVHVVVLPTGLELLGQEALRRGETDSTPLRMDTLPVGRVLLNDGLVMVEDRRHAPQRFSIEHVRLDLDRRSDQLNLALMVKLPPSMGTRIQVKGELRGSGDADSPLSWSFTVNGTSLKFSGLSALLKDVARLPLAGGGDVHWEASGAGLLCNQSTVRLKLNDLRLPAVVDGEAPVPAMLNATLTLDRPGLRPEQATRAEGSWHLNAHVNMSAGVSRWPDGQIDARWVIDAQGLASVKLQSAQLPLDALAPFSALMPQDTLRQMGHDLAPRGRLQGLDLTLSRSVASADAPRWALTGGVRLKSVEIGAYRAIPGIGPLDATLTAQGDHGVMKVNAGPFSINVAQWLRAPVSAQSLAATVRWLQSADGLHLASDDARVVADASRGGGLFRLWIPNQAEPPHLLLDLNLQDVDLHQFPQYLPGLRLSPDVNRWIDAAFIAGRLPQARLQYIGPTEGFPFRSHQGMFLVQAPFSGLHMHYSDGWTDLEDASGHVEYRNEGMYVRLDSARLGGLQVGPSSASIADFRDSEVQLKSSVAGDLHRMLHVVQSSPVGKSLGSFFAQLDGHGPTRSELAADLPLRHFGDRRISVDTHFDHNTLQVPGVEEEVTGLEGHLRVNNRDINIPQLNGTLWGGPVSVHANTEIPRGLGVGVHRTTFEVSGRAQGVNLQPQFGITQGEFLAGSTDWRVTAHMPRLEWQRVVAPTPAEPSLWAVMQARAGTPLRPNPDDPPPLVKHEWESKALPVDVHLESPLSGLQIQFPAPLKKVAADTRWLKLDLSFDPGSDPKDELPPQSLAANLISDRMRMMVRATLGADSFIGEWLPGADSDPDPDQPDSSGAALQLARAQVRFGSPEARLPASDGVWLDGHLPLFDLSAWMAVQTSDKPGRPMNTWLKGGTLVIDQFSFLGFNFKDLRGSLAAGPQGWLVKANGPDAQGTVSVPYAMTGPLPLTLDMDHLVLNDHQLSAASGPASSRVPPSALPSMQAHVANLEFQKRHLGDTNASVIRVPGGLKLEKADFKAPSFTAHAAGTWLGEGEAELCDVAVTLHSTDLRETLVALAFEPSTAAETFDVHGQLRWHNGIDDTILERLSGRLHVQAHQGQMLTVQPGAGRVFGLLSIAMLPRRLALDFHDLTDKGFAFDSIQGDFEFREGNAYTNNIAVKGPAADIGLVGRTGFKAQDYDQIAVVTGHFSDGLAAAGAIAGGPVVGGALFLFGKVFQGAVEGIARGYYRITGTWEKPKIDSIGATAAHEAQMGTAVLAAPEPADTQTPPPVVAPTGEAVPLAHPLF